MSLIVVLPGSDGIAVASDTQFSFGQHKDRVQKIFRLNQRICWIATGDYSLIQRVGHAFNAFQDSSHTLRELLPTIGSVVKNSVKELLTMDFRTEYYVNNFNAISQLHRADFVFCEWVSGPSVVHVQTVGNPSWINHPFIIGSGDAYVGALLQRYRHIQLNLSSANLLAYRLMDEAIEAGIFGLGGPIDIWNVTNDGLRSLEEKDLDDVRETLRTVRKHEVAVFERHLTTQITQ